MFQLWPKINPDDKDEDIMFQFFYLLEEERAEKEKQEQAEYDQRVEEFMQENQ